MVLPTYEISPDFKQEPESPPSSPSILPSSPSILPSFPSSLSLSHIISFRVQPIKRPPSPLPPILPSTAPKFPVVTCFKSTSRPTNFQNKKAQTTKQTSKPTTKVQATKVQITGLDDQVTSLPTSSNNENASPPISKMKMEKRTNLILLATLLLLISHCFNKSFIFFLFLVRIFFDYLVNHNEGEKGEDKSVKSPAKDTEKTTPKRRTRKRSHEDVSPPSDPVEKPKKREGKNNNKQKQSNGENERKTRSSTRLRKDGEEVECEVDSVVGKKFGTVLFIVCPSFH